MYSYHGQKILSSKHPTLSNTVTVKGRGFLADLYRSLARSFTPRIRDSEIEGVPCLPVPKPPNYDGYAQILTLALFCWFFAIFEPYGLRLRHVVLNHYYPDRAKQRAVWLYNHIIRYNYSSFIRDADYCG